MIDSDYILGRDKHSQGKIDGVVLAEVTNNNDPENLGRVKLKLLIRECTNETDWARVATFMAGGARGGYYIPEVGDEVLVAFHQGCIREPYVIGCLWNKKDKPPENNENGKNDIKKIKTRSGHELIFNDEKGKEKIILKSKSGHEIMLDDQKGELQINNSKNKCNVKMDNNGNLDINADSKINLKSKSCSVLVDSMSNKIEIKSSAQIKLKGAKVDIESDGMLSLKSNGVLNIKGSLVKIN